MASENENTENTVNTANVEETPEKADEKQLEQHVTLSATENAEVPQEPSPKRRSSGRKASVTSSSMSAEIQISAEKVRSSRTSLTEQPAQQTGDIAEKGQKQVIRYMNSYRLDSKSPFRKEVVHKIIKEVMNDLESQTYDPVVMSKTCTNLAAEIRSRVKALGFERYKLVCIVQICEKNKQSIVAQTKFLWDSERDNCAVYTLDTLQFLACAAVYGLYYE